jgi:hypothetical protein
VSERDAGLPDHEQRAWDAIVADLSGQIDLGPQFAPDPPVDEGTGSDGPTGAGDHPDPLAEPVDWDDEPDGYEPPLPPPLPRPADSISRFSWAAVVGGPLIVILTNLLEWDDWLAGMGVVLTVGGFVSLVARMKDREDDGDDGAVV